MLGAVLVCWLRGFFTSPQEPLVVSFFTTFPASGKSLSESTFLTVAKTFLLMQYYCAEHVRGVHEYALYEFTSYIRLLELITKSP